MARANVAIGMPWAESPTWPAMESLMALKSPKPGYTFVRNPHVAAPDVARNWIGRQILDNPEYRSIEWVLWHDADAALHPDTLMRLLSWGEPLVAALAFSTGAPVVPTVFVGQPDGDGALLIAVHEIYEWLKVHPQLHTHHPAIVTPRPRKSEALLPAYFTGCHCMLVHRSVLAAVEFPWFVGTADRGNREDRYFCEKARAAGFTINVDLSVVAGHCIGNKRTVGALDFAAWYVITDWEQAGKGGQDSVSEFWEAG